MGQRYLGSPNATPSPAALLVVGLGRFELGTFGPPDHRKVIFEQCLGTKSIPTNSLHGGPAPKDRPCGDLNDPC
ncbi:MAG: hypothetical protein ABGW68_00185, partial [Gammaproteobacteria bacterium]